MSAGGKAGCGFPILCTRLTASERGFEVINTAGRHNVLPNARRVTVAEHGKAIATAQDAKMFRNFANQVFSGKLNADWPRWALKTQKVMDACLESARPIRR